MRHLSFKKSYTLIATTIAAAVLFAYMPVSAQNAIDTVKPHNKLWGLAYGDFAYKANADALNRGGVNQYTLIKKNETLFQFRRIYLGFDYEINNKFTANFLLAHEDNQVTTAAAAPASTGDLLSDTKISMFIKLASITWNNILPKANLSVGQVYTPAAVLLPEVVWDYRCIERTISDLRRTPAYDFGARLSGKFYDSSQTEAGYNLMIGNGTLAKPENDNFKWFYGDVYAKFLNKRLIIDLYGDYSRINWEPTWHHQRYMLKALLAYSAPKYTVGVEGFYNKITNDCIAAKQSGPADTINTKATGISVFARGRIYKDIVSFFARYDNYDPAGNNQNSVYTKYTPLTPTYNVNTKEQFITAGIDYSPINQIHIMPNVWYTKYNNASPVKTGNGEDLVFRLSLYYVYGK